MYLVAKLEINMLEGSIWDKVLKFAIQVITEFLFEHEMIVYLCVFDRKSYEFSKKRKC